jgi:hypothetical protein
MNSFTQGSYNNSVSANIRPNVSKNMPLCFRENPSQRQRRGLAVNDTVEADANNYNNPLMTNINQPPVPMQESHYQVRQVSN